MGQMNHESTGYSPEIYAADVYAGMTIEIADNAQVVIAQTVDGDDYYVTPVQIDLIAADYRQTHPQQIDRTYVHDPLTVRTLAHRAFTEIEFLNAVEQSIMTVETDRHIYRAFKIGGVQQDYYMCARFDRESGTFPDMTPVTATLSAGLPLDLLSTHKSSSNKKRAQATAAWDEMDIDDCKIDLPPRRISRQASVSRYLGQSVIYRSGH